MPARIQAPALGFGAPVAAVPAPATTVPSQCCLLTTPMKWLGVMRMSQQAASAARSSAMCTLETVPVRRCLGALSKHASASCQVAMCCLHVHCRDGRCRHSVYASRDGHGCTQPARVDHSQGASCALTIVSPSHGALQNYLVTKAISPTQMFQAALARVAKGEFKSIFASTAPESVACRNCAVKVCMIVHHGRSQRDTPSDFQGPGLPVSRRHPCCRSARLDSSYVYTHKAIADLAQTRSRSGATAGGAVAAAPSSTATSMPRSSTTSATKRRNDEHTFSVL